MSEIARQNQIVPRSATTIIARLEAKRLVVREIDLDDRRSVLVRLTGAGLQLLDEISRARSEAAIAMCSDLAPAQSAELLRLLTALDAVAEREWAASRDCLAPGDEGERRRQ